MNFEEFKNLMYTYISNLDLKIDDDKCLKFYKYMKLLIEWNERINLTAITEPKEIIIKHFIDSLSITKYIDKNTSLIDVGTGAGFPRNTIKNI